MSEADLTPGDIAYLAARGITAGTARRQLALLEQPPRARRLVRPCTVGDGIVRVPEHEFGSLLRLHDEAAGAGSIAKFVPASGAATRMFRDLLAFREPARHVPFATVEARAAEGDREARTLLTVLTRIEEFAFWDELRDELARRGQATTESRARGDGYRHVLDAMFDERGRGFASRPKGLLAFHRYASAVRTAFEEHLVEGTALVRDAHGLCRARFTVSPDERRHFEAHAREVLPRLERETGARFDVSLSEQSGSTETLALDEHGAPLRDAAGRIVLRPGGHGALLQNLAAVDTELVQIKNIDNIARAPLGRSGILWKRIMTGLAIRLQRERDASVPQHPIRVCGVVRNEGEPGGGPFWVEAKDGTVRPQIVESSEVDTKSPEQRRVLSSATHFNPVDMVCVLRDSEGTPYRLPEFADPDAVIVTRKSFEGRDVTVLELPGLWNGAMAGWDTLFVEVPADSFTPVKSVLDLLRPEHVP